MRKSTFYGFSMLCGVGSLFLGYLVLFSSPMSCCHSPVSRVDADFSSIGSAIKLYYVNAGRPPSTDQGLDALINEPTTGPKPKRWTQMMTKVPLDPWGIPYRYTELSPRDHEWRWEIRSAGEDTVFGSPDDLVAESESGSQIDPLLARESPGAESRPSF